MHLTEPPIFITATEYRREQKKQEALRAATSNSLDSEQWENEDDVHSSHSSSGHSPDASTSTHMASSSEKKPKMRRDSLGHYVNWLKVRKLRKHISKLGHGHDSTDGPQLDALLLRCDHWLEAVDEQHRYGSNLRPYFDYWLVNESELEKGAVDDWVQEELHAGQSVDLTFDDDSREAALDAQAAREAERPLEEAKASTDNTPAPASHTVTNEPPTEPLPHASLPQATIAIDVSAPPADLSSASHVTRSPPRSMSAQHLPSAPLPGGSPTTPSLNISSLLQDASNNNLPPKAPSSLPKNLSAIAQASNSHPHPHPHPHPQKAKDRGSMPHGGWQVLLEAVAITAMQGGGGRGGGESISSRSAPGSLGSSPQALPGRFVGSLSQSELDNQIHKVVLGGNPLALGSSPSEGGPVGSSPVGSSPVGSSPLGSDAIRPFDLGLGEEEEGEDEGKEKRDGGDEEDEELRDLLDEGNTPLPSSSPRGAQGKDVHQGFFDSIKGSPSIIGLGHTREMMEPEGRSPGRSQGQPNPQDMFHRISLQDPVDQSLHRRNFFAWLDYGPGRGLDLADQGVPRSKLDSERVRYLSPQELEHYEVVVDRDTGLLKYKLSRVLLHTFLKGEDPSEVNAEPAAKGHVATDVKGEEGGEGVPVVPTQKEKKDKKWIWVVAPDGKLYVHAKIRGQFHHSSFLRGSVVMAAGNMLAEHGKLMKLTADSGHYWPKPDHFKWFFEHLKSQGADLSAPAIKGLEATGYTTKH